MRLARTAAPPPRDARLCAQEQVWPAGVEPAISGSRNRRVSRLPYSQQVVPDTAWAVSGKSTTVESNHALPPYQSGAFPSRHVVVGRRQGIAPCSTDSQPAGSLQALRRSLAGRTRTSVARGRSAALIRLSYGERTALSTGIEPASPERQSGRMPRRVREREAPRAGVGCFCTDRDSRARIPIAPRAGARRRCERPASSTARRSGHDERGCDGWGRTSIPRLTAGRPAV